MQDMNPSACASQTTPAAGATNVPAKTLTDVRDGNTYTIAKLKDGNCWMTQNLRIVGGRTLNPENSDIEKEFFLTGSVTLDSDKDSPKQFSDNDQYQSKVYYGNNDAYYNWYTATAGTGDADIGSNEADASSSICPKGWRLPTGGNNTGEFYDLVNGLTSAQIRTAPYNFSNSRDVVDSTLNTGFYGYYWSSTIKTSSSIYVLYFSNSSVNPYYTRSRYYGLSVRCVAR